KSMHQIRYRRKTMRRISKKCSPLYTFGRRPTLNFAGLSVSLIIGTEGTDETGIVTQFNYDTATERLLSIVHDQGAGRLNLTTSFDHNSRGDVTSVTDPRGNVTLFTFDLERRRKQMTEVMSPAQKSPVTKWTYSANGNLTKIERKADEAETTWQTTNISYSVTDQPTVVLDPENNPLTRVYDGMDRLWKVIDAANRVVEFAYDPMSRLLTVKDPSLVIAETRTYTPNGLVASVKDGRNNVTSYTFDGFDRPDKRIYPDASFEQIQQYDANSNVLSFRTRDGKTIVNTFDELNRLKTRSPQLLPVQTMTYDLAGRRKKVSTPVVVGDPTSGDYEFFFDTAGRLFQQRMPDGKNVTYQLDASGNITRLTYPDGYFVDYAFDEINRLTDIKLNGSATSAVHLDHDVLSRRTATVYQNGCRADYGYQIDDDMASLAHTFVGSSVSFDYDFDNIHRLIGQSVNVSPFMWTPSADRTVNYGAANNLNQYPTVDGTPLVYDNNGSLFTDGTSTYTFDTLNRLTGGVMGANVLVFRYDPMDRQGQKLVGAADTRFIYNGIQRIADYDGVSGNLVSRYVFGPGLDEPLIEVASSGAMSYFHHDRLGSIVARTDNAGAVLNSYNYGPFGETLSLAGTTFGYTGQRYDNELGLYWYKARYYSPNLGRFLQVDPIGYAGGDLNLYTYVNNDPLGSTDPLGLSPMRVGPLPTPVAEAPSPADRSKAWYGATDITPPSPTPEGYIPSIQLIKDSSGVLGGWLAPGQANNPLFTSEDTSAESAQQRRSWYIKEYWPVPPLSERMVVAQESRLYKAPNEGIRYDNFNRGFNYFVHSVDNVFEDIENAIPGVHQEKRNRAIRSLFSSPDGRFVPDFGSPIPPGRLDEPGNWFWFNEGEPDRHAPSYENWLKLHPEGRQILILKNIA
ncbi:MAG TPA: RHS repeat-associated core domain-containing protein, partial [Candidatus Obscuribacterales bacterium]